MDLDELWVSVLGTRLEATTCRTSSANHRHRRSPINQSRATGGDHNRIGGEGTDFHGEEALRYAASANTLIIEDGTKEVPRFEFPNRSLCFAASYLFVECV